MFSVKTVVELSLAARASSEEASVLRRNNIVSAVDNSARRRGALLLHDFATKFPSAAGKIIGRDAGIDEYCVGFGSEATVYRVGSNVLKVLHNSSRMDESNRQKLARERSEQYRALSAHLKDFVVDQTVTIDQHPYSPSQRVVGIYQPFTTIHDLEIMPKVGLAPNVDKLKQTLGVNDSAKANLERFISGARTFYQAEGLLPDPFGIHNFGWTDETSPRLLLIDTGPVDPNDATAQIRVLDQFEALEAALEAAA